MTLPQIIFFKINKNRKNRKSLRKKMYSFFLKIRFLKNRSIFFNLLSLYTLTIQEIITHTLKIIKRKHTK